MGRRKEEARLEAQAKGEAQYRSYERPCKLHPVTMRYTGSGVCVACHTASKERARKKAEYHVEHTFKSRSPQITNEDIYKFEFSIVRGEGEEHSVND